MVQPPCSPYGRDQEPTHCNCMVHSPGKAKFYLTPKKLLRLINSWAVNSSDEHHWAKTEPSNEIARSSAVADDFKIVASVQDDVLRSMLANALGEVGVYERGTDWERRRIESYFATLGVDRVPRDGFGIPMWILAFVGWVVAQADVQPPDRGALLAGRWLHWGDQVSGNEPIPGAVGVFKSPTDHTPRVAILLRKRKDCIDVIAGDAAGRVAIRCVKSEKLISVRRPPVGDAQGDAKPATSVEDAKPATSTDDVKPATSVEDGGGRKTR